MPSTNRRLRLAHQLQSDIALCVQRTALTDSVLKSAGVVTVTEVKLNRDASHATVYFSLLSEENKEKVEATLNHYAPRWRSEIAQKMHIYKTPQLRFCFDQTEIVANRINQLLNQVAPS